MITASCIGTGEKNRTTQGTGIGISRKIVYRFIFTWDVIIFNRIVPERDIRRICREFIHTHTIAIVLERFAG